jgi:hypothetical protein
VHSNMPPLPIHTVTTSTERMLWHQRLGHPSDYYLYHAHRFVDGVPRFKHHHPVLERCPTCIQAKQRKEPAGPNSTKKATNNYQGLSIDFSFSGTRSKNACRSRDYVGLHGETCYLLIVDHHSGCYHGITRVSKASPINWLSQFLEEHTPDCLNKYVYLDQGGELYRNPSIRRLFERYNYKVCPTGAEASNQNGPVERAHLNVANAIRAMLHGAALPAKFWPYAFHHFLRIKNATPSRGREMSPIEMTSGNKDNFSAFRTFGCRVWVRPTTKRPAKFHTVSRKGIFIGFIPGTTRYILWYDVESQLVKVAKHVQFYEGMNDMPLDAIPPNVQYLIRVQDGKPFPAEPKPTAVLLE